MAKNEPGKFTTEFWMVLVGELITITGALKGFIDPEVANIVGAVLAGAYATLRTLRKNSADKVQVEKLRNEKSKA